MEMATTILTISPDFKVNGGIKDEEIKGQCMSNLTKFVMALVGLVAMLLVASRQLFLFVIMKDSSGLSIAGGDSHLWLAAIAGVIACIASGLMFFFFGRHENSKWSKVVMTPTGPLFTPFAIKQERHDS